MPGIGHGIGIPFARKGFQWSTYWKTLYDAMTNKPSTAYAIAANKFIKTIDEGGVWAKLDRLFVFAAETNDGGEAVLDWTNPTRSATLVNSPAFVACEGFTGGTNESINTNYAPKTHGVNYKQDDAMFGVYSRTTGSALNEFEIGSNEIDAGDLVYDVLNVMLSESSAQGSINSTLHAMTGVRNRGLGLYALGRVAADKYWIYENGEKRGYYVEASRGLSSITYRVLCGTSRDLPSKFSARQISMAFFSSCLTNSEFQILNDAFEVFMKANGKGVIPSTRLVVVGDSISTQETSKWLYKAPYTDYITNSYGAGGHSIMANMDDQIVSAKAENAQIYILALGTNDNDAGDMVALQAEVEENIAELKAARPSATIYYMNVLPRWTDVGGGTEVEKTNIRAAIAAACAAQGITCWDTYTTPWITASDTSDGTHPNDAGCTKIWNEISSRL